MDWSNIWSIIATAAAPWVFPVVAAAVTVLIMWFLSKQKADYNYLKTALTVLHSIFGDKLGDKAGKVFDIWIECLDKVKDGTWTEEQMLAEFFKIVEELGTVRLSATEIADITQLTSTSVQLLSVNSKISIMSVK